MRTPKSLYAQQRLIYQPELDAYPHCGDPLTLCNYLAWDKTMQILNGVLAVASRPGCCRHATGAGSDLRLVSAEAQGIALPGSTYGDDVLVRIGWWRQQYHATYREIHTELAARLHISESHVRHLHQQVDLPLLACHERLLVGIVSDSFDQSSGAVVLCAGHDHAVLSFQTVEEFEAKAREASLS